MHVRLMTTSTSMLVIMMKLLSKISFFIDKKDHNNTTTVAVLVSIKAMTLANKKLKTNRNVCRCVKSKVKITNQIR